MAAHRNNPVDKLRTYNISELERIAVSYLKDNGHSGSVPVDIDELLEKVPGVDLDIYPALAANHGLLGMAGVDDDGVLTVYIDDKLADRSSALRRYRMTVAEELAHIILHRDAIEAVREPAHFKALHSHPEWYRCERNAKWLAAALLMPADHLIRDSSEQFQQIMRALAKVEPEPIMPSSDTIVKHMGGRLADKYLVSAQSMGYRLNDWPVEVTSKVDNAIRDGLDFLD